MQGVEWVSFEKVVWIGAGYLGEVLGPWEESWVV